MVLENYCLSFQKRNGHCEVLPTFILKQMYLQLHELKTDEYKI